MVKFLLLLLMLVLNGCSTHSEKAQSIAETIPITMANLRGHKSLYNEGWFVITSSRQALSYAKDHGIDNAAAALHKAVQSLQSDMSGFTHDISDDVSQGIKTTASLYKAGTRVSKDIISTGDALASKQVSYSKLLAEKAWESLIEGNLSLSKRTQKDRKALASLAPHYFKNLKKDFSNLGDIAQSIITNSSDDLSVLWSQAFIQAQKSFEDSYEASGESENSLMGLVHILFGYSKATYHGLIKPTVVSGVAGTYTLGKKLVQLAYLPIGATISVVGRSVESLGMTLFYTSSLGVKVVSPTVEAGFLSGLSLLSLSSSALTSVTSKGLGLMNQLGTLVVAPTGGLIYTGATGTFDTAKLVTFVTYDIARSSAEVIFNEASSGLVLGYNALLALPTHLLLGATDAVFFLAWDGPRLVLAMASGKVHNESVSELPVGSVINLSELEKQKDIKIKIISQDYKVIEKVLHELSKDARQ